MPEVTRHLVQLEGFQVLNKRRYEKTLLERRLMAIFILLAVLSVVCLLVCVSTTSWVIVDHVHTNNVTIRFHLGIWGEWRTDYNQSRTVSKVWIPHFPNAPADRRRLMNKDLPHYYRTQAIFSAITFVLMITSISFALYSFGHHRYMYKRLAAGLFVFVSMCLCVVIEVLLHSVREWSSLNDPAHLYHPPAVSGSDQWSGQADPAGTPLSVNRGESGATLLAYSPTQPAERPIEPETDYTAGMTYGYSMYLAWVIFSVYLAGAVIFLIAGRKQKGNRAATQEFEVEDRPVNLGRF